MKNKKKVQQKPEWTDQAKCTVSMSMSYILAFSALCVDMNLAVDRSMRVQRIVDRILWIMDFSAVMFIASMAAYGAKSRVTEVIKCLTIVAIFYSGYEVSYILVFMVEMQFVFTALEVHEAYKRLNYALENISHSKPVHNVSATRNPTKTVEESIHRLALAYTNLGLVVKRLEKAFSAILILLLLSVLLHLVISPYQWISFLTTKDRVNYVQLTLELFWNILHITRAVLVVEPPHLTQMDRTQTLVSQMILQNHDIQVSEELDKFYRHILMNKVTYTPMGICTLQRPLLTSILSNVVTYLVIIIQFKLLELSS
ncbi:uncharacterized protein LOC135082484 [Ostrinia nubilalis]|uniref:uncharacterized protein LOC135082484 n=1 Tax=Ostrinia nubilalis TaxID=29057 RepID=UPI003082688F